MLHTGEVIGVEEVYTGLAKGFPESVASGRAAIWRGPKANHAFLAVCALYEGDEFFILFGGHGATAVPGEEAPPAFADEWDERGGMCVVEVFGAPVDCGVAVFLCLHQGERAVAGDDHGDRSALCTFGGGLGEDVAVLGEELVQGEVGAFGVGLHVDQEEEG